jgi:hypothetical protein
VVGSPDDIEVLDWEFDDDNTEHLAQHQVEPSDVYLVWRNEPLYFRNLLG